MSDDRLADLRELLASYKHTEVATLVIELLNLRRDRWRDKLESMENPEVRGRSKECKELIQFFS